MNFLYLETLSGMGRDGGFICELAISFQILWMVFSGLMALIFMVVSHQTVLPMYVIFLRIV